MCFHTSWVSNSFSEEVLDVSNGQYTLTLLFAGEPVWLVSEQLEDLLFHSVLHVESVHFSRPAQTHTHIHTNIFKWSITAPTNKSLSLTWFVPYDAPCQWPAAPHQHSVEVQQARHEKPPLCSVPWNRNGMEWGAHWHRNWTWTRSD